MRAARHHAREIRDAKSSMRDTKQEMKAIDSDMSASEQMSVPPPVTKQGRDVYSLSKTPRNSDLRRSASAYWRKDTNQERPSDAHYYTDLTSPAGYSWQNPFLADAAKNGRKGARANMPGADISSLSAFITNNSKKYMADAYAAKNQSELSGQTFDAFRQPAPEVLESYPHYQGDWQPETSAAVEVQPTVMKPTEVQPPIAQLLAARSSESAALFSAATQAASEHMDMDFAVPVDATPESKAPDLVTAEAHPSMWSESVLHDSESNHAWTLAQPEELNEELTSALSSIESSPQCDQLFEQSAAAAGAMFQGAQPMSPIEVLQDSKTDRQFPFNAQTQAEQSTTLDSLPEQQFVDVRITAADQADTSPEILRALAYDINPDVRFAIAENHNVDISILKILAVDENPYVAHRAQKTIKRLEGGQLKQGNFSQTQSSNWLSDRRSAMS